MSGYFAMATEMKLKHLVNSHSIQNTQLPIWTKKGLVESLVFRGYPLKL